MSDKNALGFRVEGDPAKLPKWAQSYITWLERELTSARREIAVQGDVTQTNVTFCRPSELDDQYIPAGSRITFRLPSAHFPNKTFPIRVMVTREGTLDINGDSRLWMSPNAANSITIGEVK